MSQLWTDTWKEKKTKPKSSKLWHNSNDGRRCFEKPATGPRASMAQITDNFSTN
jgi:hypothetical protein